MEVVASSIGGTFPPIKLDGLYDEGNDRIKKIYTCSIEDGEELSKIFSQLLLLRSCHRLLSSDSEPVSRVTARFFVNKKAVIPQELHDDVEAQLSLDGEFADYNLVYLGRNFEGRTAKEEITSRQRDRAEGIDEGIDFSGNKSLEVIVGDEVAVRTVKPSPDDAVFDSFAKKVLEIYEDSFFGDYSFEMNLDSVRSLLRKDTNIVKVIQSRRTEEVYSIGVGETISLPLTINGSERIFSMAEISDAATPVRHHGKGYYSSIAAELTRELLATGVDLVYGEARAASSAVMTVCRKTGRRLARDYHGKPAILKKHCIINGAKESGLDETELNGKYNRLENLAVWYATRDKLKEFYLPK